MAAPDIPWDQRPWRQQRGLDEPAFIVGGWGGVEGAAKGHRAGG